MEEHADKSNHQDRVFAFINDKEFAAIGQRFEPFFELHKIEVIFDLFDVVQSDSCGNNTAKLIWKTQRDLPIELKKAIIDVYSRYFQN
ncbi:hypothetical protein SAMN05192574_101754 [Mucilaginibacter gossypiicola]|uniref:Uncharacterized protein n=1 Tax=Mucilaginibacter gossypiicola TaxID=551995 RepID=A0A1H8B1V1_9SPHI|nr:hypothetical protein [Mucilaginibacter gossypiicola]SEM76952.1 hypothetical protein SAMN05192574_101754 [Mucilaginibacter gossypiicola]